MKKIATIHISSFLTESEWACINNFHKKVNCLKKIKIISLVGSSINAKIHYEKEKGLSFKVKLPPEEQIAELLMAFRFFYLKNESTYFLRILKILSKYNTVVEVHNLFKFYKKRWKNNLFDQTLFVSVNNEKIASSMLLDLWFNAHYFHADEKKEKELRKINSILSEPFSKYMLLDSVFESIKLILKIHDSLKGIIKKP